MKQCTADLSVCVQARSAGMMFKKSAEAVLALAVTRHRGKGSIKKTIKITASALPELLHDFLNEIIYITYVKRTKVLAVSVSGVKDDGTGAEAELLVSRSRLKPQDYIHELKSVTYHGLSTKKIGGKWKAEFVIDV